MHSGICVSVAVILADWMNGWVGCFAEESVSLAFLIREFFVACMFRSSIYSDETGPRFRPLHS